MRSSLTCARLFDAFKSQSCYQSSWHPQISCPVCLKPLCLLQLPMRRRFLARQIWKLVWNELAIIKKNGLMGPENRCKNLTVLGLLTTSTLFGGMLLYSFGFAPLLFKYCSVEQAGYLLRVAFPWYYLFVITISLIGAICALVGGHVDIFKLMIPVVLFALYARQRLMPQINLASDGRAAGDAAAKKRFNLLHGASMAINFAQIAVVGTALAWFL